MAITRDALAVAQRLCHRLANGDAGVLGRVMLIDMQVAHRLDLYVDEGMAGKLLQHMVKKTDAGRNFIFARAVEVEFDIDRRFRRLRSEEHTSELQSLMRTSYAVFCLKTRTTYRTSYPQ